MSANPTDSSTDVGAGQPYGAARWALLACMLYGYSRLAYLLLSSTAGVVDSVHLLALLGGAHGLFYWRARQPGNHDVTTLVLVFLVVAFIFDAAIFVLGMLG